MVTQSNQVPGDCVMSDILQKKQKYICLRVCVWFRLHFLIGSGPFPSEHSLIGSNMLLPFMNPNPNMKGKYMQI